ncbi:hypothetical protein CMK13_11860 [Candidatus Poribacteria bacterium]|mgnify:FL=1|jgi:hypothetical protein|nr:hypothetical protein [Candidatus Poribacteria bacterium]|tara:strand:- start:2166 stop:2498 length:333 start_codon:yes stop_codon:yes gene_type:complete
MARFLEIDNTATTEGIAGIHYLNMDLITSVSTVNGLQVKITFGHSLNTQNFPQVIEIECDPTFQFENRDDSLAACMLKAMQVSQNSLNCVVELKPFLPVGTTITGVEYNN